MGWFAFVVATVVMPFFVTYSVDMMAKHGSITRSTVVTACLYGGIIFIMCRTREPYTPPIGRTRLGIGAVLALVLGVPFMLFFGMVFLGALMTDASPKLVPLAFSGTALIHGTILLRAALLNGRVPVHASCVGD